MVIQFCGQSVAYHYSCIFRFLSSKLKDKGEKLKECRKKVAEALEKALEQNKNEPRKEIPADINAIGKFLFPKY